VTDDFASSPSRLERLIGNEPEAVTATKIVGNVLEFREVAGLLLVAFGTESAAVHGQNTDSLWLSGASNAKDSEDAIPRPAGECRRSRQISRWCARTVQRPNEDGAGRARP
jgi:hypothetical protein